MATTNQAKKTTLRPCTLGTATALVKQAGELVAVTPPQPKTGYKDDNSYGAKPVFNGETYV